MAAVFIVLQTGIPDADLSLEAPPFAEGPLMSEADACAVEIALVAVVLDRGERSDAADVELSAVHVESDEGTGEAFAEPIPENSGWIR